MAGALTREHAEARTPRPARGVPRRFVLAGDEPIYLDGNSLGRLPVATRDRLRARIDEWGARARRGWHDWIERRPRRRPLAPIVGAEPGEVVVCDSTR